MDTPTLFTLAILALAILFVYASPEIKQLIDDHDNYRDTPLN